MKSWIFVLIILLNYQRIDGPELFLFKSDGYLYFKLKNNLPYKKKFNLSQAFNKTSLVLHAFNGDKKSLFIPCMEARIDEKQFSTSEYYFVELNSGQEIVQIYDPLGCRNSFFKGFNYEILLRELNEDTLYVFLEYKKKDLDYKNLPKDYYSRRIISDTIMIY